MHNKKATPLSTKINRNSWTYFWESMVYARCITSSTNLISDGKSWSAPLILSKSQILNLLHIQNHHCEIYVKPTSMQVICKLPQILNYQPIPQWFGQPLWYYHYTGFCGKTTNNSWCSVFICLTFRAPLLCYRS